jgi:serine/threonine protein kinase
MAPEAIAPMPESICHNRETNNYSMKLGRASDIWSLGCILYQIVFTRPPFAALNTIQKLSAIPNPKFEIQYPSCDDLDAVESIKSCLKRNPKERSPIVGERGLLTMKYLAIPFTTAASAQNPRQETVVFDENAVMEKHGPLIIEGVKLAVMEKLSCETNLNVLEKVFDSIDIQSLIRQAMKGHTYLSKELTAASATITATTTTTAVPATNKTQKESSSRLKTPSKLLNSLDKENQQSTKISNLGHTATKKFVGESSKAKSPLKILPLSLKQQIHNESNKLRSAQSAEGIANASKWQKAITETEPGDLRTALEKRIDQMR